MIPYDPHFQAKLKEAEPLLREALRIAERTFGKTHPSYILTLQDLAMLLIHMVSR